MSIFQIMLICWAGPLFMFLLILCSSVCLPFDLFVHPDGKLRQSGNDAYFNGFMALKWVLKRRFSEWSLWETLMSDTILNELKYQKNSLSL